MEYSNEYIDKYKNGQEIIAALQFTFGFDEAEDIAKKAIIENKQIKLKTEDEKFDYLEYEFI